MPISPLPSSSTGPLGADPLHSIQSRKGHEQAADAPAAATFSPPPRQSGNPGPLAADATVLLPATRVGAADPLSALKQKREVEQEERRTLGARPAVVDRGLASLGPCPGTDSELLRLASDTPKQASSASTAPAPKQAKFEPVAQRSCEGVAEAEQPKADTVHPDESSDSVMKLNDFLGELGDDTCLRLSKENADELMQALERPSPTSSREKESRSQYSCEVEEHEILEIGPLEPGRKCEIVSATFGPRDQPRMHADVTDAVRRCWCEKKGLRIDNIRALLNPDDAKQLKDGTGTNVLSVKCLMSVPGYDVSTGSYVEGIGRVARAVPLVTKALANVVGASLAASGYAVAKVQQTMGEESSVADNEMFQWGFASWLRLNGVKPNVVYDPIGNVGVRLRWLYSQSWGASEVPKTTPPADDMKQTPLLIANHISYIDALVLCSVFGAPKVLAKAGTLQIPLIGMFAKDIGCIEVDRSSKASRAATLDTIAAHTESWRPGDRPLLLFPEGTTSNGVNILEFKKGAFAPGAPVRPVVICYNGNWHPANTNFKVSQTGDIRQTGDAEWCEQFLNHLIHSLEVKVLPPYIPSEEERKDAALYAANVRNLVSDVYSQMSEQAEATRQARARAKPVASFVKTVVNRKWVPN